MPVPWAWKPLSSRRTGRPPRLGPPRKVPLRESLHHEPVALAVIQQQLERRACAVAKDVDGPLQRVIPQHLATDCREAINPFAKIDRVRGEKDPALWGQLQHARPSTKARTNVSSSRGDRGVCRQSRVPSARASSSWVATAGGGLAGADGTSTKPSGRAGAACGAAICFFRSISRNRNCLATRAGGKAVASATA